MSVLIQYFYQTDPLDYRLRPFTFGIWLVYFKKFIKFFRKIGFGIAFFKFNDRVLGSLFSRGNYLEKQKTNEGIFVKENLINSKILLLIRPIKDENFSSSKIF